MLNISVLASGGGTNFQAIIDAVKNGYIENASIRLLIASNFKAYALVRAAEEGIPARVIGRHGCSDGNLKTVREIGEAEISERILEALFDADTDLVVLAGYMSILSPAIIKEYRGRIINIHPSLIPKFCGKGMYGLKVHEAALAAGETVTGATVHYVDEGIDTGEIILQEKVNIKPGDNPKTLQKRVLETEHRILTTVVKMFAEGILGVDHG